MEYTRLGRTGLKVSRFCLGTMNLGQHAGEKDSLAILDKAQEAGINFVDTANVYSPRLGEGISERIIGKWLRQNGTRREQIVLATKVYGQMGEGVNDGRLSAYHIKKACEDSLRRLGVDHIDLYQMHHIDRQTPWEEIFQAMEQLVAEGKIIYLGSSNFAGWHIATANRVAMQRNFMGLVSEQSKYNLMYREIELEVLPACREYGLGLIPWSPLAAGVLGGVIKKHEGKRRLEEGLRSRIEDHRQALEKYEDLCEKLGQEPAKVALAWLLSRDGVTAPIIGPRTVEQLEGSLQALELRLDAETLKELDEIWPGPGGEAPEAYSW